MRALVYIVTCQARHGRWRRLAAPFMAPAGLMSDTPHARLSSRRQTGLMKPKPDKSKEHAIGLGCGINTAYSNDLSLVVASFIFVPKLGIYQ